MKLEFIIDKSQLISNTIKKFNSQKLSPFPEWEKLETRMYKKYKDEPAYYFINPFIKNSHMQWAIEEISRQSALNKIAIKKVFFNTISKIDKIYGEIEQSREFKKLYRETGEYLRLTKKRWEEKEADVLDFITKISGIALPKKTLTVFINHPNAGGGEAYAVNNALRWGHSEDWPNYTIVYLAHELMHIIVYAKQKDRNIMHALIELMTDNELRIRLNGRGEYFTENSHQVGHPYTRDISVKILPIWKDYIDKKLKARNIFELEDYIIKKGVA